MDKIILLAIVLPTVAVLLLLAAAPFFRDPKDKGEYPRQKGGWHE